MPTTRSAAKRLRSSAKRKLRNQIRRSVVRTTEKKYLVLIEEKNVEGAAAALKKCFSSLDKAAKGQHIHRNKADRKKSRLNAKLAALKKA